MPEVVSPLQQRVPRVGTKSSVRTWPLSLRISTRPRELTPDEATRLDDFISTERALVVRDEFKVVGAALDNIPLRLARYERRQLDAFPLAFTKTKIYKWDGSAWVDIGRAAAYTGADTDPWDSATVLNDHVATNYIDKLQFWDGVAGTFLDLPAAGGGSTLEFVRAKYLVAFGGRLFLINLKEENPLVKYGLRIRWSEDSLYRASANWSNLGSGFADLDETQDEIMGAAKLGRILVVYKRRSIFHVSETFDVNAPFLPELRISGDSDKGVGLASHMSIASLSGFHLSLFNDNVYRYDGSSLTPFGDRVIRDVIQSSNPLNLRRAFSQVVPQQNLWILWVPIGGETNPIGGYAYDYRRDQWVGRVKREVSCAGVHESVGGLAWQDATRAWQDANVPWSAEGFNVLAVGSPGDKKIYQQDPAQTFTGLAEWITGDEDFGYPDRLTGVNRIRMSVDSHGAAGTIGCSISSNSGNTFDVAATATVQAKTGEQEIFFDIFHLAKKHMFRFTTAKKVDILEWEPMYSVRGKAA